ncbi:Serine/threonine-protein kinase haspin, partial [Trichinella pseudospiralis]
LPAFLFFVVVFFNFFFSSSDIIMIRKKMPRRKAIVDRSKGTEFKMFDSLFSDSSEAMKPARKKGQGLPKTVKKIPKKQNKLEKASRSRSLDSFFSESMKILMKELSDVEKRFELHIASNQDERMQCKTPVAFGQAQNSQLGMVLESTPNLHGIYRQRMSLSNVNISLISNQSEEQVQDCDAIRETVKLLRNEPTIGKEFMRHIDSTTVLSNPASQFFRTPDIVSNRRLLDLYCSNTPSSIQILPNKARISLAYGRTIELEMDSTAMSADLFPNHISSRSGASLALHVNKSRLAENKRRDHSDESLSISPSRSSHHRLASLKNLFRQTLSFSESFKHSPLHRSDAHHHADNHKKSFFRICKTPPPLSSCNKIHWNKTPSKSIEHCNFIIKEAQEKFSFCRSVSAVGKGMVPPLEVQEKLTTSFGSVSSQTPCSNELLNMPEVSNQNEAPKHWRKIGKLAKHSYLWEGSASVISTSNDFSFSDGSFDSSINALNIILDICQQDRIMHWEEALPLKIAQPVEKIGEGTFADVYSILTDGQMTAWKVVPVEGDSIFNGEPQKTFLNILPEIIIASEVSTLSEKNYYNSMTPNLLKLLKLFLVQGSYPDILFEAWNRYSISPGTLNDRPDIFEDDQLFILFVFQQGGVDLENYNLMNFNQSQSIIDQIILTLGILEKELEFEHRDLHIGNILISPWAHETIDYVIDDKPVSLQSAGIIVHIIDFTLSRIKKGGNMIFLDLSTDEELFNGVDDYQYDIYRAMRDLTQHRWNQFWPKTNVLWLDYLMDFFLSARYKKRSLGKTQKKLLRSLRKDISKFSSCAELLQWKIEKL